MNIREIQKIINETNYIDARVNKLNCNYFADEVILSFIDEKEINILFAECYEVNFKHIEEYKKEKPLKLYEVQQIPYFIQNINVGEKGDFYIVDINVYPLYIKIKCKKIDVIKK